MLGKRLDERREMSMKRKLNVSIPDHGTFFSAADEPAVYMGRAEFNRSLLMNLLFGSRLVLPEAFFFNSSLLREHVAATNGGASLFEVAASAGLVSPAFRFSDVEDLEAAYLRMQQVYTPGDLPKRNELTDAHRSILRAVNRGLKSSDPVHPVTGESIGEGYQRAMEAHFLREDPPLGTSPADWLKMREWRHLIPKACSRTARRGQTGLQRAELVRCICQVLGADDGIAYLSLDVLEDACRSEERAEALRSFWAGMNQIHWMNTSSSFGLSASLPGYELRSGVESAMAVPSRYGSATTVVLNEGLPPVDVLLKIAPSDLLKVRSNDGAEYQEVLRESTPREEDLRKTLQKYSKGICKLAGGAQSTVFHYTAGVLAMADLLSTVCDVAQGLAQHLPPQASGQVNNWVTWTKVGVLAISLGVLGAPAIASRPRKHTFEFVVKPDVAPPNKALNATGAGAPAR
jgi:hypothetical protein